MIAIKFIRIFFVILILQVIILATEESTVYAKEETYTNSIGMEFVLIPNATFVMDSGRSREGHKVTISKPFYLGKFEVTQAQWRSVMGNNPSSTDKPDNPVDSVTWADTQEFISRLNKKEGHNRYRLPTEAEWVLAASVKDTWGSDRTFDSEETLSKYAWYIANSGGYAHPVGQKLPNPWGLYDVIGNVSEWVQDWFVYDHYNTQTYGSVDPIGPTDSNYRGDKALRGCAYGGEQVDCTVYKRMFWSRPASWLGFRLALTVE
jgi:formylglycine-generating enzyme required for sulfatase activity